MLGEMGCLGGELPEEYGGSGLDCVTSGVIIEEIARGDFNVGYLPLLASLNGQIIAHHARPELAREWLSGITSGKKICCIALTEPHGGSDAANLKLKATRDGDHFVLNGEDRKSTRLNSSHVRISYAVFCLK